MPKQPKSAVDADLIRTLADLLDETGLKEIEYGSGDWNVRVVRESAGTVVAASTPLASTAQPAIGAATEAETFADHPGLVASPMVGVVYTSPEPGQPSFVKVGDQVTEGDSILLIEAMKVFNPIKAPCSGRVARIFIGTEDPVEYGEPLMIIE